ncbi:MAG: TraI domain-containing protein, partial [Bdellovibrionaceae bacterium]|nr:TraI domain-containing protein [Pseudobdellovibrionaceae bacterium]
TQRPPSERRVLSPRWRVAYALAGLLHDVAKVYTDMRVTSEDGQVWSPFLSSLYDWGQRLSIDRYFLTWKPDREEEHESFLPALALQVLTPEILHWLSALDGSVLKRLMPFVSRQSGSIAQIVQKHDWRSVEEDLKRGLIELFPAVPSPEHRIVSAMKRLLERKTWRINEPGGRLWHTTQGVFLAWPQAGFDIVEELDRSGQIAGIPKNPYELRDLMYERGLLRRVETEGVTYDFVLLAPATLEEEGHVVYLRAVWLIQTGALFDREAFEKVPAVVGLPKDHFPQTEETASGSYQDKPDETTRGASDALPLPDEDPSLPEKSDSTQEVGHKIVPGEDEAGRMIRALAKAAASHPEWVRGDLLAHPDLAEAAGLNAGACVRVLFQAGYLEPDPANALRKVTLQDGRGWLKIKRGLKWLFQSAEAGVRMPKASVEAMKAATQTGDSNSELISLVREKLGLSQNDLARKLGVSKSYLSMFAAGERKLPEELVIKLKHLLNGQDV